MRLKFILVLALVAVIVLSSPVRAAASPQNQTETHTLWLPVTGSIPSCWVRDYGYTYRPNIAGTYYHRTYARIDPHASKWYSGYSGPKVGVEFEIYADKDGQTLILQEEMYDHPPYHFHYSWSPSGGLEENRPYYIRVRAYCSDIYTLWTPLGEFEPYRDDFQTFQP
ncbi:MAG: hypothetical protein WDZ49_08210 [Litorilinea sp.]